MLVQLNLNQDIPFLLVAVCVGLLTGYVAVVFHDAIVLISTMIFTDLRIFCKNSVIDTYWMVILPFSPSGGGFCLLSQAAQSVWNGSVGVPKIMTSFFEMSDTMLTCPLRMKLTRLPVYLSVVFLNVLFQNAFSQPLWALHHRKSLLRFGEFVSLFIGIFATIWFRLLCQFFAK